MRKLFKERKLFKGGNYMRKYGRYLFQVFLSYILSRHGTEVILDFKSSNMYYIHNSTD